MLFPTLGVGLLDFKLNASPRPELFSSPGLQLAHPCPPGVPSFKVSLELPGAPNPRVSLPREGAGPFKPHACPRPRRTQQITVFPASRPHTRLVFIGFYHAF